METTVQSRTQAVLRPHCGTYTDTARVVPESYHFHSCTRAQNWSLSTLPESGKAPRSF